jgi:hypothetical protein
MRVRKSRGAILNVLCGGRHKVSDVSAATGKTTHLTGE